MSRILRSFIFLLIAAQAFINVSYSTAAETLETFLEKTFKEELAKKMKLSEDDFSIQFESIRVYPALKSAATFNSKTAKIFGFGAVGAKRAQGLFSLSLVISDGENAGERTVSGVAKIIGPVLIVKNNILRGHIIGEEDVQSIRMPWKTLSSSSLAMSKDEAVGRRARNFIAKGDPVSSEALDEPVAITAGENIALTVLAGPGVIVHSRAVAKQEGRVGDFIRLEQPDTKKILMGVITGKKTVEVRL